MTIYPGTGPVTVTVVIDVPGITAHLDRIERLIQHLTDRQEQIAMATQADIDAIAAQLDTLGTALAQDTTDITAEIAALQAANPALDLSALQAKVASLQTNTDALTALDVANQPPAPAPAV